ncbi:MAG: hypothetical protein ACYCW6_15430 [Candidatus Xenobia bacterium]
MPKLRSMLALMAVLGLLTVVALKPAVSQTKITVPSGTKLVVVHWSASW